MTRESLLSHLDTVKARPPLVHRHIFLPVSSRRKEEPCPGADRAPGQSTVLFPNPWQRGLAYPSPHLTEGKTEARCWSLHHALPQGGKKSKGQSKQQKSLLTRSPAPASAVKPGWWEVVFIPSPGELVPRWVTAVALRKAG